MKKQMIIVTILLVIILCNLSGCGEQSPSDAMKEKIISGSWYVDVNGYFDPALGGSLYFEDDGNGFFWESSTGTSNAFTWTITDDNRLSILVNGQAEFYHFSLEEVPWESLPGRFTYQLHLIDSHGSEIILDGHTLQ